MSYSSAISPTISSRMSSIVTSPAVPPYSSITMAAWVRCACISLSRSSTGLLSGTKVAGRMSVDTGSCRLAALPKVLVMMSLR